MVLEAGRLVERGTHAGLLAGGGLYASLYETQFKIGDEKDWIYRFGTRASSRDSIQRSPSIS